MTSIMRIIFSGLIAFVPSSDDTAVCVMLVDARAPLRDKIGIPRIVRPHYPVLSVPEGAVENSVREVSWIQNHRAYYILDNEQISITPINIKKPAFVPNRISPENPERPCCWDEEVCEHLSDKEKNERSMKCPHEPAYDYMHQKRSLEWLLRFPKGSPDEKIKGHCFSVDPPVPGTVVARFLLDSGSLATYRLQGEATWSDQDPREVSLVYFDDESLARAVAKEVFLEIDFGSKGVRALLEAKPLVGGGSIVPILVEANPGNNVEIRVENSPLQEIAAPGSPHSVVFSKAHFLHFYRMTDQETGDIPKEIKPTGGDLLCPPIEGKGY